MREQNYLIAWKSSTIIAQQLSKKFNFDNQHFFQTYEFVFIRPFTEVPSTSVPNMSVKCSKIRRAVNLHNFVTVLSMEVHNGVHHDDKQLYFEKT